MDRTPKVQKYASDGLSFSTVIDDQVESPEGTGALLVEVDESADSGTGAAQLWLRQKGEDLPEGTYRLSLLWKSMENLPVTLEIIGEISPYDIGIRAKHTEIPAEWKTETFDFQIEDIEPGKSIRLPMISFGSAPRGARFWIASIKVEALESESSKSAQARTAVPPDYSSAEMAQPVFRKDGSVLCGSKELNIRPWYGMRLIVNGSDSLGIAESFDLNAGGLDTRAFRRKLSLDLKGAAVPNEVITSNSYLGKIDAVNSWNVAILKKVGTYQFGMTLRSDHLIEVASILALDDPGIQKYRAMRFEVPETLNMAVDYRKGDKIKRYDQSSGMNKKGAALVDASFTFFPDEPEKTFTIFPQDCASVSIDKKGISVNGKPGLLKFLIDLRGEKLSTSENVAPNGISLWKADQLRLPDHGTSRNIVMNPSFEAGMRYWGYQTTSSTALPVKHSKIFEPDTAVGRTGGNSLRIRVLPVKNAMRVATYALPFVPGEKYTFSFYAKASQDQRFTCELSGRGVRSDNPYFSFDAKPTFLLEKDWKRFTIAGTAQEPFYSIIFNTLPETSVGESPEYIWIDDVQIEKGDLTAFESTLPSMELLSSARGNFLEYGKPLGLNLTLHTLPNAAGTIAIRVEDFFFRTIYECEIKFTSNSDGKATLPLPELDSKISGDKLRGVFSVKATMSIDGREKPYVEDFRFSVMNFLENTHRNKNLFSVTPTYSSFFGGPDMERYLERFKAIGIGAMSCDFTAHGANLPYDIEAERVEMLNRYGIDHLGNAIMGYDACAEDVMSGLKMEHVNKMTNPTDEELAKFEAICEMKAKNRPWNKLWWFYWESTGLQPLESHPEAFAKFLLATLRGVKKGNPEARVLIEGGSWNIKPDQGVKWTERYIQEAKKIDPTAQFDGAGGHWYPDIPEKYGMDENLAAMIEMLDRNGCKDWPIIMSEGGMFSPLHLPQIGADPYESQSGMMHWYNPPFSYHIGRSERISAAYLARSWLVGLKYQNRVKVMSDMATILRYMDFDFTPSLNDKIPNTLGRLLGNASFSQDLRFAPDCTSYIFKEDPTGSPIAAVWCHKESVDRWTEAPPVYQFDFSGQKLKFVDLMENEIEFPKTKEGNLLIPISAFPLFIIGQPGSEQNLAAAISDARPQSGNSSQLSVTAMPVIGGKALVSFKNKISKPYSGSPTVLLNEQKIVLDLRIESKTSEDREINIPEGDALGRIIPFRFTCTEGDKTIASVAGEYANISAIPEVVALDQTRQSWSLSPAIPLNGWKTPTQPISIKVGHEDGMLVLTLCAKGTNLKAEDVFAGTGIYFDPFCYPADWAVPKTSKQHLGIYELQKDKEGGLQAFCHVVQGVMEFSGDNLRSQRVRESIKVECSNGEESICVRIKIPEYVVTPATITVGAKIGLNISVPESEGIVKSLAPIDGYRSVAEPGSLNLILILVGK